MKRVTYATENDLECLRYLSKCYDFALSLCISLAFNELDTSIVYLREQKNFKQELKYFANNAVKEADLKRAQIRNIMVSKGFFDSYADRVIDLASKDISSFSKAIERVLGKNEIGDPHLYAQIETTRCLLQSCVLDFKGIAEDARKKFGIDRSSVFKEYDISKVYYWFEKATTIMYKTVNDISGNINLKTSATSRLWNKIHKKIADGEYIEECMRAANEEHPEFMNNDIKVKEWV